MEQDIGGYGNISSGSTSSFESYPEIAQYFLKNVNLAKEYLEEILEIEEEDESEDEDEVEEEDELV
jgi:hypothetical protein